MRSWQENLCRSNFVKDEFLKSLFDAYSHSSPRLCTSTQNITKHNTGVSFSHDAYNKKPFFVKGSTSL